jgi:hypothetical protein
MTPVRFFMFSRGFLCRAHMKFFVRVPYYIKYRKANYRRKKAPDRCQALHIKEGRNRKRQRHNNSKDKHPFNT